MTEAGLETSQAIGVIVGGRLRWLGRGGEENEEEEEEEEASFSSTFSSSSSSPPPPPPTSLKSAPVSSLSSLALFTSPCQSLEATTTESPASKCSLAIAFPSPLLPPVTTTERGSSGDAQAVRDARGSRTQA